jgi:hypothetical protein
MAAGGRIVTVGRVAFEVFSGMDILSKDQELMERSHREGGDDCALAFGGLTGKRQGTNLHK